VIPKIAPDKSQTLRTCARCSPTSRTISNSRSAPLRKAARSMTSHTPKALTQSMILPFGSILCPLADQSRRHTWQGRSLAEEGARPRKPIHESGYACPPITRRNALSCCASTRWSRCAANTAPVPWASVRRVIPSADARTISPNRGSSVTGAGA
jgi:hypothetical protein